MNIWRLRKPRQWWHGHHWSYTNQPLSPTSDRRCKRCGKFQRMRIVDVRNELWSWVTLNQGNTTKVCNEARDRADKVWFDEAARWGEKL